MIIVFTFSIITTKVGLYFYAHSSCINHTMYRKELFKNYLEVYAGRHYTIRVHIQ